MKEVRAYKCSYCKFISTNKKATKFHEFHCSWNPRSGNCSRCKYFLMGFGCADDSCKYGLRIFPRSCKKFKLIGK